MNATISEVQKPTNNATKKHLRSMEVSDTKAITFHDVDEKRHTSLRNIVSQLRKEDLDFTTDYNKEEKKYIVWRDK